MPTLKQMSFVPTLRATLNLVRNDRRLFLVLLAISLFSGLLSGIGDPFFLKLLIDSLGGGGIGRFLVLAAALAGVYTVSRLARYQAALLTRKLKNRICEDLSSRVFRAFYRLPYPEVLRRDKGYFVSRIYDEPAKITEGVDLLVELFSSAVMFTGALGLCLWLSWKVAIALSIIVPTLIVISDRFGSRIRQSTLDETESEAELRDGLGRAVESYKTVNVSASTPRPTAPSVTGSTPTSGTSTTVPVTPGASRPRAGSSSPTPSWRCWSASACR